MQVLQEHKPYGRVKISFSPIPIFIWAIFETEILRELDGGC